MMWWKKDEPAYPEKFKASHVDIRMGTLVLLEEIVEPGKLQQILENQQVHITIAQKRRLMIEVFGYSPEEADAAPPELFEAECGIFFSRWLRKSLQGQIESSLHPLSDGKLPEQLRQSISSSKN